MRKHLILAAFAALMFTEPAFADSTDDSDRIPEPCPGCGTRKPAPKPVPVPAPAPKPAPEPEPEVVVPPPAPAPVVHNHYSYAVDETYGFVRLGGSVGGDVGLWSLPADVIGRGHPMLPAAELKLGGYIGVGGFEKGQPYFDLHAAYSRGSVASVGYSGGLTVGYSITNHVILGVSAQGGMRDYLVTDQTYVAQYIGAGGGLTAIIDIGSPSDALDFSIVPALSVEGGGAKNVVTGERVPATDLTIGVGVRLGLRGPWRK